MQELWEAFGKAIPQILRKSPFAPWISQAQQLPYMSYLNWFIPFGEILEVFGAWLVCVAVFYAAQIVLRWVKVIQG